MVCTSIDVSYECVNLKPDFSICIGGVKLKTCDNNGDLMSPVSHEAVAGTQGANCGNSGTSRSGDGPDQRARSPLGRWNRGELFPYFSPYFYSPLSRTHINPSLFLKLNNISSGSPRQKHLDHHLQDPVRVTLSIPE